MDTNEGPGVECCRGGLPVTVLDLAAAGARWPRFTERARQAGFVSVQALPLHLRERTIGALNLYSTDTGGRLAWSARTAQALANTATIGTLQERTIAQGDDVNEQLQAALTSRVVIEQAKGALARHARITAEEAFTRLRRHARSHNLRLAELARAVMAGEVDLARSSLRVLAVGADPAPWPGTSFSVSTGAFDGYTPPLR